MKVLFVINWYTLKSQKTIQAGIFHYEQCMALKKYADVRLYWPYDTEVTKLESGDENGLYVYRSPMKGKKVMKYIHVYHYLDRIIKEYKPDIIHANCANLSGFISDIVAKKYHIPVVLTEHAPLELMWLESRRNRFIHNYAYTHSTNFCVSIDSMNKLKEQFPKATFSVNYNGIINPDNIKLENTVYRKQDIYNCAIVAGFYDKDIKGYQYLIPAIKEANEKGTNVVLHIVGGGIYEDYYKNFAKEIGAEKYCIFYGACNKEKVYSIISQMDFCISASIFECSGVSVQEEMLLGKPVLVTRSGGANSLTTEDTAIVVDRSSKEALVDGLLQMCNTFKKFDSNKIHEYAYKNFEITQVTNKYYETYCELLKKKDRKN